MLARLVPLLLLLLTRDGVVHRLQDGHDIGPEKSTEAVPHATAIAALADGRVAVLAGGRVTVLDHGRRRLLPGRFDDLRALAAGSGLWGLGAAGVLRLDGAKPANALADRAVRRLAADGPDAFAAVDGALVQLGSDRRWPLPGHAIALAAAAGKLFAATKEGPLFELDRASGRLRDLGLGDWWGTLALAAAPDGQLYAVTVSGKLWHIDPVARTKTIVAMDGWQSAIDLAVLR
jgi:hypothetical protein